MKEKRDYTLTLKMRKCSLLPVKTTETDIKLTFLYSGCIYVCAEFTLMTILKYKCKIWCRGEDVRV